MKVNPKPVFEFRAPQTDEEFRDVSRLMSVAFAAKEEPVDPRARGLTQEQFFCAYDEDRLVSTAGAFAFDMTLNGKFVPTDGVTIVCTDPGYRRQGLVRSTMTQMLHDAHRRQVPIAILWASMGAIYQRFGYGYATNWNSYTVAPKDIVFRDKLEDRGVIRRIPDREEALKMLEPLYNAFIEGSTMEIKRTAARWKYILPDEKGKERLVAVWFDENAKPRGYLIYENELKMDDTSMYQIMRVVDFVWSDMASCRGLWGYLASNDLGREVHFVFRPDDDPVTTLLLEPRVLHHRVADGLWLRIVDVDKALEARGYDTDGEVTFTIDKDDICSWNEGTWKLCVKDGVPVVQKAEAKTSQFTITPQALATLLCGFRSATQLCDSEQITKTGGADLRKIDVLFSTRTRPNCANMF